MKKIENFGMQLVWDGQLKIKKQNTQINKKDKRTYRANKIKQSGISFTISSRSIDLYSNCVLTYIYLFFSIIILKYINNLFLEKTQRTSKRGKITSYS